MRHGNPTDYMHPFMDRPNRETKAEAVERVVAIGLEALKAWYSRTRHDTHPDTFGATGSALADSVCFMATGGEVRREFADETAPRFEAARRLGIEINWV